MHLVIETSWVTLGRKSELQLLSNDELHPFHEVAVEAVLFSFIFQSYLISSLHLLPRFLLPISLLIDLTRKRILKPQRDPIHQENLHRHQQPRRLPIK